MSPVRPDLPTAAPALLAAPTISTATIFAAAIMLLVSGVVLATDGQVPSITAVAGLSDG